MPATIDASLLDCAAEPGLPDGKLTSRVVARLLSDTTFAGRDCRDKLAEVKKLVGQQP